MKKMHFNYYWPILLGLIACQKNLTTKESAEEMFRAPSGERSSKIKEKFQPIDHRIKGTEDKPKESP